MEPIDPFTGASLPAANRENRRVRRKHSERAQFDSIFDVSEGEADAAESVHHGLVEPDSDLETLLDEVHEIGERVKEHPTISVVQEYRHAVGDFLSYVVRHTLAVEQRESGPNVLKRKRFTLIKVIDRKLDRLAAGVVLNQRDQLDLLRRIDEISGLLVDLLS